MPRKSNEKLKLLKVLQLLWEQTDDGHSLTAEKIAQLLTADGVSCERKSIYRDIEVLEDFGFDIIHSKNGFSMGCRVFEIAELKLLVDAVEASRFITAKKSSEIVKKLSSMTDCYSAEKLRRSVKCEGSGATDNKTVLYNIDILHSAIDGNRAVSFKYFDWTPEKKKALRRGGALYEVSPWSLWWDDEKYYLIAFDEKYGEIRHYRVDKMTSVCELERERQGKAEYARLNFDDYSKKMFGMFGGEECTVTLRCEDSLAGVIIDRFGMEITIFPTDKGYFRACPRVQVSNNFLSWVLQFGSRMTVEGPEDIRRRMLSLLDISRRAHENVY